MIEGQNVFNKLVEAILDNGAKKATKFLSDKYVIKATRQGVADKRDSRVTILLTLGAPNFEERDFIKKCNKVGEPFPIKKIQLKFNENK